MFLGRNQLSVPYQDNTIQHVRSLEESLECDEMASGRSCHGKFADEHFLHSYED